MWKNLLFFLLAVTVSVFFVGISSLEAAKANNKPECVELVMVLDKSGSMSGLESDTIGGFNAMIKKEKNLGVKVNVTTVLFSDEIDTIYDREDIHYIKPLTEEDYEVGGMTALLDAVGSTILKVANTKDIKKKGVKVVFVIITDGMENASLEFTKKDVKRLILEKQEKDDWDFIYLGANIDAAQEAGDIGVDRSNAVTYSNTKSGVRKNFEAVAAYMQETVDSEEGIVSESWKEHIEKDETQE